MKNGGIVMADRVSEIRNELSGKTGMSPGIEEDLFVRIAEIEEAEHIVKPMTKADIYFDIVLVIAAGILPVILVGTGVL